jgi:hypothetical protein
MYGSGSGPDPDPSIIKQNSKKSLDPTLDLLSLKNYVNVPSKSNKQKNFCFQQLFFCRRLEGH